MPVGTSGGTYVVAFEEGVLHAWMGGLVVHHQVWGEGAGAVEGGYTGGPQPDPPAPPSSSSFQSKTDICACGVARRQPPKSWCQRVGPFQNGDVVTVAS